MTPVYKEIKTNVVRCSAKLLKKDKSALLCCGCTPSQYLDAADDEGDDMQGCINPKVCPNRESLIECTDDCEYAQAKRCGNRRFTKRQYAEVRKESFGAKGWGVVATKPIEKGAFIVEYVGELIDEEEKERRAAKYKNDSNNYMLKVDNQLTIDARDLGNSSRLVNHRCGDPNAEIQMWLVEGYKRMGFLAKKNIAAGEEITIDYNFKRSDKEFPCLCGSSSCSGVVGVGKSKSLDGQPSSSSSSAAAPKKNGEKQSDSAAPKPTAISKQDGDEKPMDALASQPTAFSSQPVTYASKPVMYDSQQKSQEIATDHVPASEGLSLTPGSLPYTTLNPSQNYGYGRPSPDLSQQMQQAPFGCSPAPSPQMPQAQPSFGYSPAPSPWQGNGRGRVFSGYGHGQMRSDGYTPICYYVPVHQVQVAPQTQVQPPPFPFETPKMQVPMPPPFPLETPKH